jgi:predicted nucleotidyltransferase
LATGVKEVNIMTFIIEKNKNKLIELCRKYHVIQLDVFGSVATDEFNAETSDIDFLVQFDSSIKRNRFDNFFALRQELITLFGRDIDLVEPDGLRNPYFIEQVNQTRKKIYAVS